MSLKDIMVHLDQGARTEARLEIALALARRHGARLTGVFGRRAEPHQVGVVATWPSADYAATAAASQATFARSTSGLRAEWLDINRGGDAALLGLITDQARYADLVIMGQHDESQPALVPPELPENVAVNCGRPVLVIPYLGSYSAEFRRPMIAWNDSREAAHALNDALPLIEGCKEAVVLSVATHVERAEASCQAVVRHLANHGIAAIPEVLVVEDIGIMDMLLNRVSDHAADLLVMGAHAQIGFPFVSRGVGTRHIMHSMTVPVLMSN